MAALSSGMPPASVYFVFPSRRARIAASFTRSGVSKSGSPAVKERTSMPWALRARARAERARVGDGVRRRARSASMSRFAPLRGSRGSRSAAVQLLPKPLLHAGGDQARDRAPVTGDFLDQTRGDVRVRLVRHEEDGLDLLAQLPIHQGHLELVLEIRHRAEPANDRARSD